MKALLHRLRKTNPAVSGLPSDVRLLASQFIVKYYFIHAQYNPTQPERSVKRDMKRAWNLLDHNNDLSPKQAQEFAACRVDIAVRLRDVPKLRDAYEDLRKPKTIEETLRCVSTAAILGRWKDIRLLGGKMSARHLKALRELHAVALRHPQTMDLSVLYSMCQYDSPVVPRSVSELRWRILRCVNIYSCSKSVMSQNRELFAGFARTLGGSAKQDWRELVSIRGWLYPIIRSGAVVQTMSLSALHFPLIGCTSRSDMFLQGFTDLPGSNARIVERLKLKRSSGAHLSQLFKHLQICFSERYKKSFTNNMSTKERQRRAGILQRFSYVSRNIKFVQVWVGTYSQSYQIRSKDASLDGELDGRLGLSASSANEVWSLAPSGEDTTISQSLIVVLEKENSKGLD